MQPISVIVIAYNEEKYLPLTLASLARQTESDFEVIVVDSNSTDGTETVARQYGSRLPAFQYLKLPQALGPARGRNRGAAIAANDRFLFLDADTVLQPHFLAVAGTELTALKADVATCPLRILERSMLADLGAVFLNTSMRVLRPVYASAYGACLFSTRQVHERLGGFDETIGICEDCHYVKTARKMGFRFRILQPVFHTSDRRAKHEGGGKIMVKYLGCHLWRMLTGREILRNQIKYIYGDF